MLGLRFLRFFLLVCPIAKSTVHLQTHLRFLRGSIVDTKDTNFSWDKAFFEKKTTLFTNLQMGFVGAALMLMMMDLSKPYLLAPLVVGLILASWYKHHIDGVKDKVKNASIQFSPKSILITLPNQESETRVRFRQIEEIDRRREHFVDVVTLYLKDDEEKIELSAINDADALIKKLNNSIAELNEASEH